MKAHIEGMTVLSVTIDGDTTSTRWKSVIVNRLIVANVCWHNVTFAATVPADTQADIIESLGECKQCGNGNYGETGGSINAFDNVDHSSPFDLFCDDCGARKVDGDCKECEGLDATITPLASLTGYSYKCFNCGNVKSYPGLCGDCWEVSIVNPDNAPLMQVDEYRPDADGNIYPENVVCSYCHNETCGPDCDNYQAPSAHFDSKNKTLTVYGSNGAEIVYDDIVAFNEIENVIKQHKIHWDDVTWKISQKEYRYYHQFLYNYQFKRFCYYCDTNHDGYVGDECNNCFYDNVVKLLDELGSSPQ